MEAQAPQFCVILRGPAGAGKSALAQAIQRELSQKVAVIDTDIFSWQIVPGEDDKAMVYKNVVTLASNYLGRGYSVVVEGLIITSEEDGAMARLCQLATSHRALFLDVFCRIPKHLALQRNRGREKGVNDQLIEEWWNLAEGDKNNVQWPLVELNMTVDVAQCAAQVLGSLTSGGAPEQGEQP